MPDHACDRGAVRLDPGASRSQAYQPEEGVPTLKSEQAQRRSLGEVATRRKLQPDDGVLDVACGPGAFLKKHASHVHHIAGLDHSGIQIKSGVTVEV